MLKASLHPTDKVEAQDEGISPSDKEASYGLLQKMMLGLPSSGADAGCDAGRDAMLEARVSEVTKEECGYVGFSPEACWGQLWGV